MYHSIQFGDVNTYDDWLIVPSTRPVINPPKQKTQTLDVPGANGSLDISESLTGYPLFENRTGDIEFIVLNDYKTYRWEEVYEKILNYLHGKQMKCVLEDDPAYYYEGRYTVNKWDSQKDWSRITISYDVKPYKYYLTNSLDEWFWDPFNFRNGVILPMLFKNCESKSDDIYTYYLFHPIDFGMAPVTPNWRITTDSTNGMDIVVAVGNNTIVNYDGDTITGFTVGSDTRTYSAHINDGISKMYELSIYNKMVIVGAKGKGHFSLDFRRGML